MTAEELTDVASDLHLLADQASRRYAVRREQLGDPGEVDAGDDDLANLGRDPSEDPVRLHLAEARSGGVKDGGPPNRSRAGDEGRSP